MTSLRGPGEGRGDLNAQEGACLLGAKSIVDLAAVFLDSASNG